MSEKTIRGRCVSVEPLVIQNSAGFHAFGEKPIYGSMQPGDIIEISQTETGAIGKVLTQNQTPSRSTRWMNRVLSPRRRKNMKIRSQVENGIRNFFLSRDFEEVKTPILVPCPGMEPHIRPFELTTGAFLPTSPEFAMKKLLVGGLEKIFQLSSSFRYEPVSPMHHPEFKMLEWYRAYEGYEAIMNDVEDLVCTLAQNETFTYEGRVISLKRPWPRWTVRELFEKHAGIDLSKCPDSSNLVKHATRLGLTPSSLNWDDLYFLIWLNVIEPKLPENQAFFVTRYPASQAALSVKDRDPDGSLWAKRFEFYIAGMELGNAFEELTDPIEQRARFVADMELRKKTYGDEFPVNPLDEEFLHALEEGMPPASGIAVGVDRLVMLLADENELDQTLWLESFSGSSCT